MIQELRDQAIREEGIEKGIEQGIEQGLEQGRLLGKNETQKQNISTLMDTLNISEAEAKQLLKIED